jgi:hypothetical protein
LFSSHPKVIIPVDGKAFDIYFWKIFRSPVPAVAIIEKQCPVHILCKLNDPEVIPEIGLYDIGSTFKTVFLHQDIPAATLIEHPYFVGDHGR